MSRPSTPGETIYLVDLIIRNKTPCLLHRDEELAAVGAGARVGHAQHSGPLVLEGEVLVLELGTVDGRPARSVRVFEVSALSSPRKNPPPQQPHTFVLRFR